MAPQRYDLCLIGLLISHPLPGWLGGAQEIRRNATLYFMMFAIMLPFSQLNSLMSSFLQCSGDMVTPSILNAVMCVLDVIFNALLIPVFGVMGAGMGTMLACAVISLTGAWFCCVRNPQLRLRRKEKTVFDAKILKTAFKIGVPVAVQEIAMNSAMVAATMLIAPLGSIAIAANSFAVTAEGLCYMPGYVCAKPSEPWQHLGHPPRSRGASHHPARPARHVDRHGYRALHPRIAAALPPAYIEIL